MMGKSRCGYKRSRSYEPLPGVRIEITTAEVYDILQQCARGNRCTIGQWAESNLRYALSGTPLIEAPRRLACVTRLEKVRIFYIDERLFEAVAAKVGDERAMEWVKATLLYLARIEIERQRGVAIEVDRFG